MYLICIIHTTCVYNRIVDNFSGIHVKILGMRMSASAYVCICLYEEPTIYYEYV